MAEDPNEDGESTPFAPRVVLGVILTTCWMLGTALQWDRGALNLATSGIIASATCMADRCASEGAAPLLSRVYDRQEHSGHLVDGYLQEVQEYEDMHRNADGEALMGSEDPDEEVQAHRAQVHRLDSTGRVDWTWLTSHGGLNPEKPPKGDIWRNRARVNAILGQQAMVFGASLKGSIRCKEQVNILRDSGATRDFVHPGEVRKRGLTVYITPTCTSGHIGRRERGQVQPSGQIEARFQSVRVHHCCVRPRHGGESRLYRRPGHAMAVNAGRLHVK